MLDTVIVVNNFLHDFASGLWAATLLVLYLFYRYTPKHSSPLRGEELGGGPTLRRIFDIIFILFLASLAVIIVTGIVRLLTYNYYTTRVVTVTFGLTKRTLLIAKHILLISIYGAGTWFAFHLRHQINKRVDKVS